MLTDKQTRVNMCVSTNEKTKKTHINKKGGEKDEIRNKDDNRAGKKTGSNGAYGLPGRFRPRGKTRLPDVHAGNESGKEHQGHENSIGGVKIWKESR